ncbi:MAG: glycosyltransferase [Candidatus Margulisbacteria bacterium]|nr:glycosyltransferase [Candidatus Margulisiibacteriota bacterium]
MILICVALEKEIPKEFKEQYPNHWFRLSGLKSGQINQIKHQAVIVVVTGVGQNAQDSLRWLLQHITPKEIINIGTAGSTTLSKHHWVMLTQVTHEMTTFHCHYQTSLPIPYHQFPQAEGRTVSSISYAAQGGAIDMEAFFLAAVSHDQGITFTSFKYITDANNTNTESDFNASLTCFHSEFLTLLSYCFEPSTGISVIIPTFNRHQSLTRALNSVLNQSHPAQEVLVVDDGSNPAVTSPSNHVNVIALTKNHGVSYARNVGIAASKAPWLCFLDSDDEWSTNHLETLNNHIIEHPLCRWAQTDEQWIRNGRPFNKKKYHQKPNGWAFEPSLHRCLVSPSAVMVHRHLFDWFGTFNEDLPACEDYDLWLRLLRFLPVGFANEVTMTKYGGHSDQLSSMPLLDKYRVRVLIALHRDEHVPQRRKQIETMLQFKLKILLDGATKRYQTTEVAEYTKIMHEIQHQ